MSKGLIYRLTGCCVYITVVHKLWVPYLPGD